MHSITDIIQQIDWKQVLAAWLIAEQVIANTESLKANSTLQLICNCIDAVINVLKGAKNEKVTDNSNPLG